MVAQFPAEEKSCLRSHPFRLLTAFAATFPKGTAFGGGGKVSGITQRRPLGGAGERSETEGVLGLTGAVPHPALRATSPRWVKASALPEISSLYLNFSDELYGLAPPLGELARERLRGFIPRKKAAAPGTVQRLVYNIKVSQFFFAA